mgnify:CR=1 FL=1
MNGYGVQFMKKTVFVSRGGNEMTEVIFTVSLNIIVPWKKVPGLAKPLS